MHFYISSFAGVVLAGFIIWEVVKSFRDYRNLKKALAQGDSGARPRFYNRILRFEWVTAALALIALGFDKKKLVASTLQVNDTAFAHWVSSSDVSGKSGLMAIGAGLLIGLVLMTVMRLRSRRRPASAENSAKAWWRRFVPDIAPLIPATSHERWLFAAVAISAGICEEIVFRGWLLYTLHTPFGLSGTTLILVAAALFGLCHIYQGPTGVLGASLAGIILSALYIGTGTLFMPIVLHALIDLRVAILPARKTEVTKSPVVANLNASQRA
jgi:uncharacterized protein